MRWRYFDKVFLHNEVRGLVNSVRDRVRPSSLVSLFSESLDPATFGIVVIWSLPTATTTMTSCWELSCATVCEQIGNLRTRMTSGAIRKKGRLHLSRQQWFWQLLFRQYLCWQDLLYDIEDKQIMPT